MSYSPATWKGETTTTYGQSNTLFKDLAALLTGQLFSAWGRCLWIGAPTLEWQVKTRPDVRCLSVEDVIHTVRWTHGLPLSVRGAGHEIFGRSLRENGWLISPRWELSPLIQLHAQPTFAGATAVSWLRQQKNGLATTTGTVSSVGMTGLTLGRRFADRGLWAGCR